MKKPFAFALAAIAAFSLRAAEPGENLVMNGRFEIDQTKLPLYWLHPERAVIGESIFFDQAGGPKGTPCVRYVNKDIPQARFGFRQVGYTLVPGAKYRLSAMVRTKNFTGKGCVYVVTQGWTGEAGFDGFPENSEWTPYSRDIVAPPTPHAKNYGVILYVRDFFGEVSFADLKLQPLDEAAVAGSRAPSTALCEKEPRFFPWAPYLTEIDAKDRKVSFRFAGELPKGDRIEDYVATLSVETETTELPLSREVMEFTLPGAAASGRLAYTVAKKGAAEPLLKGSFPYRTIAKASIDTRGHKRLNNLVTEVFSQRIRGSKTAEFSTVRDGWVFVRADDAQAAVTLDGEEVIKGAAPRREAMRRVVAGRHRLGVVGATGGTITVRQIAEILNYPSCADSRVTTNPSYGWDFFSRYVMPNTTTHCGGEIPVEHQAEFKAHGGIFLGNIVTRGHTGPEISDIVYNCKVLKNPRFDGVALDEHLFGEPGGFGDFVGGMRDFTARYDGGSKIYSWIVGKPLLMGFDRETFALGANASPDGAMVMSEVYCRSRPTEEEARQHIKDYLVDTGRKFKEIRPGMGFYPNSMARTGLVLANFSQLPILSVWHHPETDFKYFLDLQFQALATDPAFDGLGLVGFWGSYYCDEEIYRWSFMLARHYCLEGKTELLSKEYGLSFRPGHLANGDFNDDFKHWRTSGEVKTETIKGFAENVERRWGGAASGDKFAVLVKKDGKTAKLGQKLKNLQVGRKYTLEVVTFDAKDARTKTRRPAEHPLKVTLGAEAEVDTALSWHFVDRREKTERDWGVRVNRHHIVFTAKAEEISLMFDNAAAEEGAETGLNGVSVCPYVAAE